MDESNKPTQDSLYRGEVQKEYKQIGLFGDMARNIFCKLVGKPNPEDEVSASYEEFLDTLKNEAQRRRYGVKTQEDFVREAIEKKRNSATVLRLRAQDVVNKEIQTQARSPRLPMKKEKSLFQRVVESKERQNEFQSNQR